VRPPLPRWLRAAVASVALVAAVTATIALLEPKVPALGLGVLYLLAVVPIALLYGGAVAAAVSVASMAAFSYFFVPPRHSLNPGTLDRWSVLAAFLASSLVVGQLAARAQQEARRSRRLADEQAALRRVATLVARESPPEELFAAVVEEVGRVFPVENVGMGRYESDGTMTTVAISDTLADAFPVGDRWPLGGRNLSTLIFDSGGSARIDSYVDASGRLGVAMRARALRSSVGAPIVVEGRTWGVMTLASTDQPLAADTETRLASFTELVATAISNAEARTELAASRARIVAATDEERRRVVRDLHDGAQQRLVHTVITLKLAQRAARDGPQDVPALIDEALDNAEQATVELRELTHGILPAVLTRDGLRAGVDMLASRMPVPVEIDVSVDRLPPAVEATAYFVVAEALTNIAKHAHAGHAEVTALVEDGTVRVQVRDDGVGGVRPGGSGLIGLGDRLATLHGELSIESPAGGGTVVAAVIPLSG
jgi:signal transduction histidine kinase